jgi:sugar lactone lactonase YvrE
VTLAPDGSFIIADTYNHRIRRLGVDGTVTTIAGSGRYGYLDSLAGEAQFARPEGVAVDSIGNIYVSDTYNHAIRKIDTTGLVSTFVGGTRGFLDSIGIHAKFNYPYHITMGPDHHIYVADASNHRIRKVSLTGEVTTIAGNGMASSLDGQDTSASFNFPYSLVFDLAGNLIVSDNNGNKIRKISPINEVTTIAGNKNFALKDGIGIEASFNYPAGLSVDRSGNIYVADTYNNVIRKILPDGTVSTFAGSGRYNNKDGKRDQAEFANPVGLVIDSLGNLYMSTQGGGSFIKKVETAKFIVGNTTGQEGQYSFELNAIANNQSATQDYNLTVFESIPPAFSMPDTIRIPETTTGVFYALSATDNITADTSIIFVIEEGLDGAFFTIQNQELALQQVLDFESPKDENEDGSYQFVVTAIDELGNKTTETLVVEITNVSGEGVSLLTDFMDTTINQAFYLEYPIIFSADSGNEISFTGSLPNWMQMFKKPGDEVKTLAGNGIAGIVNGSVDSATFNSPMGVAVDSGGNVYVADVANNMIRKISSDGTVSTLAGNSTAGNTDGTLAIATFNTPIDIEIDSKGNLFIADYGNHSIRKIDTLGNVTTFAGSGTAGLVDGQGTSASFNNPAGLAIDRFDNVYVADYINHSIRKISPTGNVTTIAGNGTQGTTDGHVSVAQFNRPADLVVDSIGNIFVADRFNYRIRKISTDSIVSIYGFNNYNRGGVDSTGYVGGNFHGIAIDNSGNLYVADQQSSRVWFINADGYVSKRVGGSGFADGKASDVRFRNPHGIALGPNGRLYIADRSNHAIRYFETGGDFIGGFPNEQTGTFPVTVSATDGTNTDTKNFAVTVVPQILPEFDQPDTVFVQENTLEGFFKLNALDQNGLAASFDYIFWSTNGDGRYFELVGDSLKFRTPVDYELPSDSDGDNIYTIITQASNPFNYRAKDTINIVVTDQAGEPLLITGNPPLTIDEGTLFNYKVELSTEDTINSITVNTLIKPDWINQVQEPGGQLSIIAGTGNWGSGTGIGTNAAFFHPTDIAVDTLGNLYVADSRNNMIKKINLHDSVGRYIGSGADFVAQRLYKPTSLAFDREGNLFFVEQDSRIIRKVTPDGTLSTYAGNGGSSTIDGQDSVASFRYPHKIEVDRIGNVYVTDLYDRAIRRIDTTGYVSTINLTQIGANDLVIGKDGFIYTVDRNNNAVYRMDSIGRVEVYSGVNDYYSSQIDGPREVAQFIAPSSLTIDETGNIYVGQGNGFLRKIDTTGYVTTVDYRKIGSFSSRFAGMAFALDNSLIIADENNHLVNRIGTAPFLVGNTTGKVGTYPIEIQAAQGLETVTQSFTLTVKDITAPVFSGDRFSSVADSDTEVFYTVRATDNVTAQPTFTLVQTQDAQFFSLRGSNLRLLQPLSVANKVDQNKDNVFELLILATDEANNQSEFSLFVQLYEDTRPSLNAPANLLLTGITENNINKISMRWDAVDSAETYTIAYYPQLDPNNIKFKGGIRDTDYTIIGLSPQTTYRVGVMAKDSDKRYNPSGYTWSFITSSFGTLVLDTVSDLTVSNWETSGFVGARLDWTGVPDALQYIARYRPLNSTEWYNQEWTKEHSGADSIIIAGLLPNTVYEFRVVSVYESGDSKIKSAMTQPVYFRTADVNAIVLEAPEVVSIDTLMDNGFSIAEVAFDTVAGSDRSVALFKPTASTSYYSKVWVDVPNDTAVLSNLESSEAYMVRMQSEVFVGSELYKSELGPIHYFTSQVAMVTCGNIVSLTATSSDTSITLSWAGTGDFYQVQYNTLGVRDYRRIDTSDQTLEITDLSENTTYQIYVRQSCSGIFGPFQRILVTTQQSAGARKPSALKEALIAYPNPASNNIFINAEQVTVLNSLGQKIYQGEGGNLDVSRWQRGYYLIKSGSEVIKVLLY